ncbi:hypothetical protein OF83DRAFT_454951 [Amylostereum chailletii]|nr:hypothetical protein OF83DRAFT_454951 [Amylostereum chailletii]
MLQKLSRLLGPIGPVLHKFRLAARTIQLSDPSSAGSDTPSHFLRRRLTHRALYPAQASPPKIKTSKYFSLSVESCVGRRCDEPMAGQCARTTQGRSSLPHPCGSNLPLGTGWFRARMSDLFLPLADAVTLRPSEPARSSHAADARTLPRCSDRRAEVPASHRPMLPASSCTVHNAHCSENARAVSQPYNTMFPRRLGVRLRGATMFPPSSLCIARHVRPANPSRSSWSSHRPNNELSFYLFLSIGKSRRLLHPTRARRDRRDRRDPALCPPRSTPHRSLVLAS